MYHLFTLFSIVYLFQLHFITIVYTACLKSARANEVCPIGKKKANP
jgi:hypothetical protein